jgi:hypothetical protein
MTTYWEGNTSQEVKRDGEYSAVVQGAGYKFPGEASVILENTGNGYIARFPSHRCTAQDYYV